MQKVEAHLQQRAVTAVSFTGARVPSASAGPDLRHAGNELGKGPDCPGNLHLLGKSGRALPCRKQLCMNKPATSWSHLTVANGGLGLSSTGRRSQGFGQCVTRAQGSWQRRFLMHLPRGSAAPWPSLEIPPEDAGISTQRDLSPRTPSPRLRHLPVPGNKAVHFFCKLG